MKATFFIIIAALCLQLCGSFLTAVIVAESCGGDSTPKWCNKNDDASGDIDPKNGAIWGIYLACLIPFAGISLFQFYRY